MTKSMIKPKNILLTLKEHNANNCRIMKQSTMQDMHTERDPIAAQRNPLAPGFNYYTIYIYVFQKLEK